MTTPRSRSRTSITPAWSTSGSTASTPARSPAKSCAGGVEWEGVRGHDSTRSPKWNSRKEHKETQREAVLEGGRRSKSCTVDCPQVLASPCVSLRLLAFFAANFGVRVQSSLSPGSFCQVHCQVHSCQRRSRSARYAARVVSSVVEHYLDTVGVAGSNPAPRTISSSRSISFDGGNCGVLKHPAQL